MFDNKIVERVVQKCDSRNPFDIARSLGIEYQIGNIGIAGCYMFLKNHRYIFLNQDLPSHELTLVMAHELGHAIMHRRQNCYFIRNKTLLLTSKIEQEANLFAAHLLITDDCIEENRGCTIEQFARLTGYSEDFVRLRISA